MAANTGLAATTKEQTAAKRKAFEGLVQSSAKLSKFSVVVVKNGDKGRNAVIPAKAYTAADAARLASEAEINAGSLVVAVFKGVVENLL